MREDSEGVIGVGIVGRRRWRLGLRILVCRERGFFRWFIRGRSLRSREAGSGNGEREQAQESQGELDAETGHGQRQKLRRGSRLPRRESKTRERQKSMLKTGYKVKGQTERRVEHVIGGFAFSLK